MCKCCTSSPRLQVRLQTPKATHTCQMLVLVTIKLLLKWNLIMHHQTLLNVGAWWWYSGQHPCLLLRQFKFKSCWLLNISVQFLEKTKKYKKRLAGFSPLKKLYWMCPRSDAIRFDLNEAFWQLLKNLFEGDEPIFVKKKVKKLRRLRFGFGLRRTRDRKKSSAIKVFNDVRKSSVSQPPPLQKNRRRCWWTFNPDWDFAVEVDEAQ